LLPVYLVLRAQWLEAEQPAVRKSLKNTPSLVPLGSEEGNLRPNPAILFVRGAREWQAIKSSGWDGRL
jgi:hypothetical protein